MIRTLNLCLRSREVAYISRRRNIQTLLLHWEHDSFSEFILLGLGSIFTRRPALSIGESVGRGMIDYTGTWDCLVWAWQPG